MSFSKNATSTKLQFKWRDLRFASCSYMTSHARVEQGKPDIFRYSMPAKRELDFSKGGMAS